MQSTMTATTNDSGATGNVPFEDHTNAEPDYRFTLANERPFLSWVRTSLALVGGGIAVARFLTDAGPPVFPLAAGVGLVSFGAIISILAYRRWRLTDRAIRAGAPSRPPRCPLRWRLPSLRVQSSPRLCWPSTLAERGSVVRVPFPPNGAALFHHAWPRRGEHGPYQAVQPPSTMSVCPVM